MSEKRPYGLTEDDQFKLHRARNVLRLLQYLSEADKQGPLEPELLGSAYGLLAEQLDAVIASSEHRTGRARA
ncbi:hypothetical protein FBY21_1633 [Pseudomonas sp. SLBN-26]|uniref:hypothetical protein n=1 Tax=Pseudomonadaceae TaxID=135621 RepID=UPI000DA739C8|nr:MULTISPECIES: hypothetical protein [Pseudomonas]MBO2927260.1 hypothetical protein [Pseudomonas otitidis]MCP1617031.1 hypothetical protein [Pseudomonas otitidis]MDU9395400.1 hypothetical protein [Pseudomonas sp. zfem003]PZE09700.1 hypothetical protein DMX10_29795 [Pseudomonas sp. 57B-090624]TQL06275.1 hypothetical protein FBY21_1633 [Pseudomonas sp. SLBN-26]